MFNPVIFLCRPVQVLSKWSDPMAGPSAWLPMATRLPASSDAQAILRQMIGYPLLIPYANQPKHWRASQHCILWIPNWLLNLQVIPASNKPSRSDSWLDFLAFRKRGELYANRFRVLIKSTTVLCGVLRKTSRDREVQKETTGRCTGLRGDVWAWLLKPRMCTVTSAHVTWCCKLLTESDWMWVVWSSSPPDLGIF